MAKEPPLIDLEIETAEGGFYDGFSKDVTITAKILIGGLILWAVACSDNAPAILSTLKGFLLSSFATWYFWVVAFLLVFGSARIGHQAMFNATLPEAVQALPAEDIATIHGSPFDKIQRSKQG